MTGVYGKNPHYQFRDQDPVIDIMRTFWQASQLTLTEVAHNSGLSRQTLTNWFVTKAVRVPRHDSVMIYFRSFGVSYGVRDSARRTRILRSVAS